MTSKIELFYNGTGLVAPVEDLSKWESFKQSCLKQIGKITPKQMKDQLDIYEEEIVKYIYLDKCIGGKAVNQTKMLDKIFKDKGINGVTATTIWCMNILCLLELGELKEDDNNGIMAMGCVGKTFIICKNGADFQRYLKNASVEKIDAIAVSMNKEQKLCGNCKEPAKSKCQFCPVKYCSRECQVADWKKHKKTCQENTKHNQETLSYLKK
jgi:hypothetical protein